MWFSLRHPTWRGWGCDWGLPFPRFSRGPDRGGFFNSPSRLRSPQTCRCAPWAATRHGIILMKPIRGLADWYYRSGVHQSRQREESGRVSRRRTSDHGPDRGRERGVGGHPRPRPRGLASHPSTVPAPDRWGRSPHRCRRKSASGPSRRLSGAYVVQSFTSQSRYQILPA
jgi:hypothetical protein